MLMIDRYVKDLAIEVLLWLRTVTVTPLNRPSLTRSVPGPATVACDQVGQPWPTASPDYDSERVGY